MLADGALSKTVRVKKPSKKKSAHKKAR
jgi:hypothetical protein